MQLMGLFPVPIGRSNIGRKFTKAEINFFLKVKDESKKTIYGYHASTNTSILETQELTSIQISCINSLNSFVELYNEPKDKNLEFFITQSWLTYITQQEEIPLHSYQNSLLSGMLFIEAEEGKNSLYFSNPYTQLNIEYTPTEWNPFNSKHWFIPVRSGDIIIYPSKLSYFFRPLVDSSERIALLFNTYVKGPVGSEDQFSEIIL